MTNATDRLSLAPHLSLPQHLAQPLSVYVHVPFCQKRCIYCDFATFVGQSHQMPAYVSALEREIEVRACSLGRPSVQTIYFGGGTPSLLPPALLEQLLNSVRRWFEVDPRAEITMEANPGTLDAERLSDYRLAGVNRLSVGVQTLDDRKLHLLGRMHSSAEATASFSLARRNGFDNLSADLIYALPGQSLANWRDTLARLTDFELPHLSLYALTPEEGTPLWRSLQRNELKLPTSDRAADMYEWSREFLASRGYRHYEISNWCLSGSESRHNMAYWVQTPYLGFGVSAHGYFNGERRGNVRGLAAYLRRIESGSDPSVTIELIDTRRARSDAMVFGLRLIDGVDRAYFISRYGVDPTDEWPDQIRHLAELDLLRISEQRVSLTPRGQLLGNYVWSHFL